jgi:hypothetical protein
MDAIFKFHLNNLRNSLKEARKKYGRNSKQVFKIVKELKTVNPFNKYESVKDWEEHTLDRGSFGLRSND